MFRKFVIASAAVVALGTASLAVSATPATAGGGGKGFHHHHHGHGFGGLRIYSGVGLYGYDSCYRTRWVVNRYGELVRRVVNVCY